jgi:hypothetical protein
LSNAYSDEMTTTINFKQIKPPNADLVRRWLAELD